MDKQTYKITVDLWGFPMAEDISWECDDGVTRRGAFIPYEENNVYTGDKHAYMNMVAVPNRDDVRHCAPCDAADTHALHPYWTRAHTAEMHEKGYEQRILYYGWMSVRGFANRIKADNTNERGPKPKKKRRYVRRKKKEVEG